MQSDGQYGLWPAFASAVVLFVALPEPDNQIEPG